MLRRIAVGALGVTLATAATASAAITPVDGTPAGAQQLAAAIATPSADIGAATFDAVPPNGTPNAVSTTPLASFPTAGDSYAILTNGDATLADQPNDSGSSGADDGGAPVRGDSDYDVTILKIPVTVGPQDNCLSFDFRFLSEEYPEYVGSQYNDAFIAELDTSDWTTSGSAISAPHNFAFDPNHDVVSINSSGVAAMSAAEAAGTTYDGATQLLSAGTTVTPGAHTLYLSIFDQGDHVLDSAVFVDNLTVGFRPNPGVQCAPGAQQKNYNLTLTPATATNPVGTDHTVTATLTDAGTGDAIPDATIQFTTSPVNPTSGTGTTDANGQATYTYTGVNAGTDNIVACYDADSSGPPCGNTGDPVASAQKTWTSSGPTCDGMTPTITGSGTINGTSGDDVILGSSHADTINGRGGDDVICGGGGGDRIQGGAGDDNDTLMGGSGRNTLLGNGGDDTLTGGPSRDILVGGAGNDTLNGAGGQDSLGGGLGDDSLDGGPANDTCGGGPGTDTATGCETTHGIP